MAKQKLVDIRFPMGGISRRNAFQNQPPYTTPDAQNVWPDSYPSYRERGGSRPGLVPAFREQLGSGNPIRMMAQLHVVEGSGFTYWSDSFLGSSLGSVWTQGTWTGITGTPSVTDGYAYADYAASSSFAVSRSDLSPTIDAAEPYVIEMYIAPYQGAHRGTYTIYGRMTSGLDPLTNGIVAALTITGSTGVYTGSLKTYASGSLVNTYAFSGGTDGWPASGWFVVKVNADTITCYWRGNTLVTQDISGDGLAAGTRFGWGMTPTVTGGRTICDRVRVQYDATGGNQKANRAYLCASSNGSLYIEDFMGSLAAVSSSLSLASDRRIMAQERLQDLYIADYGDPKVEGTDGVRGTGNAKFDATGVSDWTTKGISVNDDVVVISEATGNIVDGTYKISSVDSGEITLTAEFATGSTGTCSYSIQRAPKVYDTATGTLAIWTASNGGQVPSGQPLLALWRDRMVMAGGADSPHNWYMSRQADPLDWDYADVDEGGAVAGTAGGAIAGLIGEPITALIPHADTCLYFGCYNSLYIMRGDPKTSGTLDPVSLTIGVVGQYAWCYTPDFQIVFLSHDGLYIITQPCSLEKPMSLSRERMPAELLNIDRNLADVSLVYDLQRRGIHIYVVYKDSRSSTHWFFDWENKGFWKTSLTATQEPTAALAYYSYESEDNGVLLGGRDGYVRRYSHWDGKDDGNNTISSYCWYGPFNLGGDQYYEGVIAEVGCQTARGSASISYDIFVGDNAEDAYTSSTEYTGTFSAEGLNPFHNPRVRGSAGFIKVSNGTTRPWSLESLQMRVMQAGRLRY